MCWFVCVCNKIQITKEAKNKEGLEKEIIFNYLKSEHHHRHHQRYYCFFVSFLLSIRTSISISSHILMKLLLVFLLVWLVNVLIIT